MQIESAKLSATQGKNLEKMSEILSSLLEQADRQRLAMQQNERIEEQRYLENTRLSRVAAWSSIISMIVAVVGIIVQIALS